MEKSDKIVAYISKNGELKETDTFFLPNSNAKKDLLLLLHRIANGLEKGTRITFTTEL